MTPGCAGRHAGRSGYCPTCGLLLDDRAPAAVVCPGCGAPQEGGSYCERCGHLLAEPARPQPVPPPRPARWFAVVTADRGLFDALRAVDHGFAFPDLAQRRVRLAGGRIRIGRSGAAIPEIDLCGPPPDPGVSHLHAELLRRTDGGWTLHDRGGVNGTFVRGRRLTAQAAVPVEAGEKIRLGLWSRITLVVDG